MNMEFCGSPHGAACNDRRCSGCLHHHSIGSSSLDGDACRLTDDMMPTPKKKPATKTQNQEHCQTAPAPSFGCLPILDKIYSSIVSINKTSSEIGGTLEAVNTKIESLSKQVEDLEIQIKAHGDAIHGIESRITKHMWVGIVTVTGLACILLGVASVLDMKGTVALIKTLLR